MYVIKVDIGNIKKGHLACMMLLGTTKLVKVTFFKSLHNGYLLGT